MNPRAEFAHCTRYAAGSPAELLPLGTPQALVHGTADTTVPYEISQRYVAAARGSGDSVELITANGLGHPKLRDPNSAAWPTIVGTVERLIGQPAP